MEQTSESHPYHNWSFRNNSKAVEKETGGHWHRNKDSRIAEECNLVFWKDPQESS